MTPFQQIPDSLVILFNRGTYTQSSLYRRDEKVYAKRGGGYVRLFANGGTSVPTVIWKEYDPGDLTIADGPHYLSIISPQRAAKAA